LTNRGVLLAIVSKNTEEIALEAVDRHPEMVLRRDDFVAWRINWDDKVQNTIALVSELRLGLESVVFIDDNPAERARVREGLPQVLVPEWPEDKLLYEQALTELTCFDTVALSTEDRSRTRTYVSERERTAARQSAQSVEEYLALLGLRVDVEPLTRSNSLRAVQLLNKTNQMNLATRRFTEAQYLQWASAETNHVFVYHVRDRFDNYGLTGVASLCVNGTDGQVLDFVLSCRVMGRGVEQTMLYALAEEGRRLGLTRLVASYMPTPRNGPCKAFFDEASGFDRSDDGLHYGWDFSRQYLAPAHVEVYRTHNGST
jgi:FkbH-like protein